MEQPLLTVRELQTYFRTERGLAKAVDGVSFEVRSGEVLGIVGESGSGKSVTALSVLRLIPDPPGIIAGGQIEFGGRDLLKLSYRDMAKIRGHDIAMIFQEPMTSLNPVFTVGMQVMEALRAHERVSTSEARRRAIEMLQRVAIPDAAKRMNNYPHQFSGGMLQRVMIAMALICRPRLLIADEPTTALDVTTQAQILDLMLELKAAQPDSAIMLITHDLGVVAETCHRVVVMYGGKIQEMGTVEQILTSPQHPYTRGLLASLPSAHAGKQRRLRAIPGNVPSLMNLPKGCKFCTRCEVVEDRCHSIEPPLVQLADGRSVRCHLQSNST